MSSIGTLSRRLSSLPLCKFVTSKTNLIATKDLSLRSTLLSSFPTAAAALPPVLSTRRFFASHDSNDNGNKGGGDSDNAAWVEFQKSIRVEGFDTGQQTTTTSFVQGKRRGGKRARARRERLLAEREAERGDETIVGGGHFPAMRYDPEETERLLAEAYTGLPERAGPRGSRRIKRGERKMRDKRRYHRKKKRELIRAHFARNEKLSQKYRDICQAKEDAVETRERDREYQQGVLERYLDALEASLKKENDESADAQNEEKVFVVSNKD